MENKYKILGLLGVFIPIMWLIICYVVIYDFYIKKSDWLCGRLKLRLVITLLLIALCVKFKDVFILLIIMFINVVFVSWKWLITIKKIGWYCNLNVQGFTLHIYYINKIWGFSCQNLLHHLKLQGTKPLYSIIIKLKLA